MNFHHSFQIEQLVRLELPCVRQVMVVGEGQDHLAALLTLHTDIDEKTKLPGNVLTEDVRRWFRQSRYFLDGSACLVQ